MEIPSDPTGLPPKVFNAHLDKMMETGQLNPDILPYMNQFQQGVCNEVKKAFKRIKNKYAGQISEDTEGVESTQESV